MKHVHRAYHWIREQVERRTIAVSHVPGDENPADIFTKPLGRIKFAKFRAMLGLRATGCAAVCRGGCVGT